jgi:RimJ/RimL family protein N-acetyltransferase
VTRDLPTLVTGRLTLRPFRVADAASVQALAGDVEIYRTTTNIPHPYDDGMAEQWIASRPESFRAGEGVALAMSRTRDDVVVGCVGLTIRPAERQAELGYWVGVPFWHNGYATEAAMALVDYGFAALGIAKVTARHFAGNPKSGRVLQKIGMTREAVLRHYVCKDGVFHDVVVYGVANPADPASRDS